MTLRRLAAIMGFCFMLAATVTVLHVFTVAWLFGQGEVVLVLDRFGERSLELVLVFIGFCLVPITIYEADRLVRAEA